MKKLITIVFALASIIGYGQELKNDTTNINDYKAKHELGFAAGSTMGTGISYRYWKKGVGLQATLGLADNNTSIGLLGLYKLKERKTADLFLWFGGDHLSRDGLSSRTNLGFGPGIEFSKNKVVGFNIMFGYGLYDIGFQSRTDFAGGIGLFYKL